MAQTIQRQLLIFFCKRKNGLEVSQNTPTTPVEVSRDDLQCYEMSYKNVLDLVHYMSFSIRMTRREPYRGTFAANFVASALRKAVPTCGKTHAKPPHSGQPWYVVDTSRRRQRWDKNGCFGGITNAYVNNQKLEMCS